MSIITEKVFKIVRPDSIFYPDAQEYEYFLNWYSVNSGLHSWMFTDFEEKQKVTGEIVAQNSENINKIFESAENQIRLVAENLTENQFNVICKILRAKNIFRVHKDATIEMVAIISSEYTKRKSDFRYDFEIVVQKENSKIYR